MEELNIKGKITRMKNCNGEYVGEEMDLEKLWEELHYFFDNKGLQFCGELGPDEIS